MGRYGYRDRYARSQGGAANIMTTSKQRTAARRNIKSAAKAAKRKRTVAHLPKKTRTALGKEGAKAAARKR
jgi:hypothetical protein